jgi:death-on-curing protein
MKEPSWLTASIVIRVHEELLARFGGLDGIRDETLLDSALSRPQHAFAYSPADLYDLASEYALDIVKNHPFLDGNKRTGFMAAYIFLGMNAQVFTAPEEEVVFFTRSLAAGEVSRQEYALWLKKSCAD